MADQSDLTLKKVTKQWAKDYWLVTPWNALAFFTTSGLTKWLCGRVGNTGYGTSSGNFKLSGVMFLAAIVAALFIQVGSALFKIKKDEQSDAFWWAGTWIMIGMAGSFTLFGRGVLILIGAIAPGSKPPDFLAWVFDPSILEWLEKLGDP